jgi:hypothetical protein
MVKFQQICHGNNARMGAKAQRDGQFLGSSAAILGFLLSRNWSGIYSRQYLSDIWYSRGQKVGYINNSLAGVCVLIISLITE